VATTAIVSDGRPRIAAGAKEIVAVTIHATKCTRVSSSGLIEVCEWCTSWKCHNAATRWRITWLSQPTRSLSTNEVLRGPDAEETFAPTRREGALQPG